MLEIKTGKELYEFLGVEKCIDEKGNKLYDDFIEFKGKPIGFSVKRKYPENISYVVPKTKKGEDDEVCLIRVAYDYFKSKEKNKKYLYIDFGLFSKYLNKHFDYNFEDEDCPTKESVMKSKETEKYRPLRFEIYEKIYIDLEKGKLFNWKGKEIDFCEYLQKYFAKHIRKSKKIKGIPIRLKLSLKGFFYKLSKLSLKIIVYLIEEVFDYKIVNKDDLEYMIDCYIKRENMKRIEVKSGKMKLFGYETSYKIFVLISFIIVGSYILNYFLKFNWSFIKYLFSNSYVLIYLTILIIWTFDKLIPEILRVMNNCICYLKDKFFL